MKTERKVNLAATPVLRGLVMQSQPHALVRPAGAGTPLLTPKSRPGAAPAEVRSAPGTPGYEQAFAEGRKDGYAAGRLAGLAEGHQLLQARDDAARAAAVEEGRLQGLRDGQAQAQVELKRAQRDAADAAELAVSERLDRLDQLLRSVAAETAHRVAGAEEELVALAHEAICRILGREVAAPAVIRAMVIHLLEVHGQRERLAVHVHPGDFDTLLRSADGAEKWRWVSDNSVQMGGVILRSPEGSLDARLENQLAALREALLEVRLDRRAAARHAAAMSLLGAPQ